MSDSYTKLFSSITESTIWSEPAGTRLVWITMLAKCNRKGEFYSSVPGLARLANVTMDECKTALETLMAPDEWSRTPDHDGRRIEPIDGGWRLLNHAKFDKMRSEIEADERRAEYKRKWDREHRGNRPNSANRGDSTPDKPPTTPDTTPTVSDTPPTPTPTVTPRARSKAIAQRAARFDDFWAAYPVKKGKAKALKSWKAKGCDAFADQIIAHVGRMKAQDDDWKRGYVPHGSTYVTSELWEDEPKAAPNARGSPQPSKTYTALQNLEEMKRGRRLDQRRAGDGYPEAPLLESRQNPGQ